MKKLNLTFLSIFFILINIFNDSSGFTENIYSNNSLKRSSKRKFKRKLFYGISFFGYIFYLLNKKYKYIDLNKYLDIYLKFLQEKFENYKNKNGKKYLALENKNLEIISENLIKGLTKNLKICFEDFNLELQNLVETRGYIDVSIKKILKYNADSEYILEEIRKDLNNLNSKLDSFIEKKKSNDDENFEKNVLKEEIKKEEIDGSEK